MGETFIRRTQADEYLAARYHQVEANHASQSPATETVRIGDGGQTIRSVILPCLYIFKTIGSTMDSTVTGSNGD
jgi:hypothetical protein